MDDLLKSSLADYTDKKLIAILRDGRKLFGILRTYDQFSNLVLQATVERIYAGQVYTDIPRGVFIIRGENLVFLGECDKAMKETSRAEPDVQLVLQMQREEFSKKERCEQIRQRIFHENGFGREFEMELF